MSVLKGEDGIWESVADGSDPVWGIKKPLSDDVTFYLRFEEWIGICSVLTWEWKPGQSQPDLS